MHAAPATLRAVNNDVVYLLLFFALLVLPRALQRFRIPAPLTCLAMGVGAMLAWGPRAHDPLVAWLSTFGISALFLFAGLEVDLASLRRRLRPLGAHLAIRALSVGGVAWAAMHGLDMAWQPAVLLAMALMTPSTGFILDTLERLGLDEEERFWVTSKAIAGELLALAALFVVLLADDPARLGLSSLALGGLLVGLPLAFVAGLAARLLRSRMPLLASDENLHAVRLFATFFVPFYFFSAGTHVPPGAVSLQALGLGLLLSAVVLPLRIGVVWAQRRAMFGEDHRSSLRVAVSLAPTLVFTLVLVAILQSRFGLDDALCGALVLYAAISTALPSLVLKQPFDPSPLEPRVPGEPA